MWPFVAIYVPKAHGDIPPYLMVLLPYFPISQLGKGTMIYQQQQMHKLTLHWDTPDP